MQTSSRSTEHLHKDAFGRRESTSFRADGDIQDVKSECTAHDEYLGCIWKSLWGLTLHTNQTRQLSSPAAARRFSYDLNQAPIRIRDRASRNERG